MKDLFFSGLYVFWVISFFTLMYILAEVKTLVIFGRLCEVAKKFCDDNDIVNAVIMVAYLQQLKANEKFLCLAFWRGEEFYIKDCARFSAAIKPFIDETKTRDVPAVQ